MNEKLNILIIEDNPADSNLVSIFLKAIYDGKTILSVAVSLKKALELVEENNYDVIILDLSLPDSSGLETFIKLHDDVPNIPVIVLTGLEDETLGINAVKMGAQDFLQKNDLDERLLKKSIAHSIERQKLAHSLAENTHALFLEKQKLSEAQKLAHIGNWEWDIATNEVIWSDEFYQIHGIEASEDKLYSEAVTDFIHPEDLENVRNVFKKILGTFNQSSFTYRIIRKDGTIRTISSTGDVVLNEKGEVAKLIGTGQDITERVEEENLRRAHQVAEHSLRVKDQFLANMSHEIRTPMNAIIGFTGLLFKTNLSEEQTKYLHYIKSSGENLLVIINDILDFSKVQSGKVQFEQTTFNLSKIISEFVESMLPKSLEKKIKLTCNTDPNIPEFLLGDPTRLSQILNNLVGNALKFTEKGEVNVSAELVKKDDERAEIKFSVSDTGIGIPKDKIASIFDYFTQASSETTRKYGGTGLGLAIVKQLVEQQGGKLTVESKVNDGTVFTFYLSFLLGAGKKEVNKVTYVPKDGVNAEEVSILLVEDNELNSFLAEKILKDWNWKVDIAENAFVALDKIQQNRYDLVLMDIQLPDMDGYEATRKIRNEMPGDKRNVPIIAMTAHALPSEEEKCLQSGMNGYISKPFEPENLHGIIISALHITDNFTAVLQETKPDEEKRNHSKHTNLDYLKGIAKNNHEFVEQMLQLFIEQTPPALERLDKAIDKKDWDSVRAIAHKMKPSITFVGLKEIEQDIPALEDYALAKANLNLIPTLYEKINKVCAEAVEELKDEIEHLK